MADIRILLTGGGGAATRNVVRSLRLADTTYHVVAVDRTATFLGASGADETGLVVDAADGDYVPSLERLVKEHDVDVLHPQPDPEVLRLSAEPSTPALPHALPPHHVLEVASDKQRTADVLGAAGVAVPLSLPVGSSLEDSWHTVAARGDGTVWVRAIRGAGSRASLPTRSPDEARAWMAYWEGRSLTVDDFMFAQLLPGREFAVQTLWWDGELIASQGRERLEYLLGFLTPSGQTSSPAVARISNRADIYEAAHAAVRAIAARPHGIYSVDMKCDGADVPHVTEINAGRFFTTSLYLSTVGANFPDLFMRLAAGRDVEPLGVAPVPEGAGLWVRSVDMEPMLVSEP